MSKERIELEPGTSEFSTSGGRSFSRILQEIVNHLTEIIRAEVDLARTEIGRDLRQVANAGRLLAIGAVFALYAFGFVLLAAVYALETWLTPWLSAAIVAAGAALIATVFFQMGVKRVKQSDLRPDKTIQSLKENMTWTTK